MNKDKEKIDQLIDLTTRSLVFSMHKEGYTMDQICKNLRIAKIKVVDMLRGLSKKQ